MPVALLAPVLTGLLFLDGELSHLDGAVLMVVFVAWLAATLADEGQGLLVNPGHPSQMMLDAGTLRWLTEALAARPSMASAESARRHRHGRNRS